MKKQFYLILFSVVFLFKSNAQFSVTASLGTTGPTTYTSLTKAGGVFSAINAGTHRGIITVSVTANSTTEDGANTLNASGSGSSSYSSITIYAMGSARTISGAVTAGTPLITLNGADNLTIDGRLGGSGASNSLIIENSTASTTSNTSTILFKTDATNNTIKYCTIKGSADYNSLSTVTGTICFSSTSCTNGNDNNTIEYNTLTRSGAASTTMPCSAIFSNGSSATINHDNITISNNNIEYFERNGIFLYSYSDNWSITNNSFYQPASYQLVANQRAIYIYGANGTSTFSITGNYIGGKSSSCGGTAYTLTDASIGYSFTGIDCYASGGNVTISSNWISNLDITNNNSSMFTAISADGNSAYTIGASGNGNIIGSNTASGAIILKMDGSATNIRGIYLGSSVGSNSTISYNEFGLMTFQLKSGAATPLSPSVKLIQINKGIVSITSNILGAQTINCNTSSLPLYSISFESLTSGNSSITNNTIQNISMATGTGNFYGINVTPTTSNNVRNISISSNTIGSTTSNNISLAQNNAAYGINCQALPSSGSNQVSITVTSNTIQQFNLTNAGSSTNFIGISNAGGIISATYNTIKNITSNSTSAASIKGIYDFKNETTIISNNEISSITTSGGFIGIDIFNSTNTNYTISSNVIGNSTNNNISISYNGTNYGMNLTSNSTYSLTSNTIQELNLTNTGSSNLFYGIYLSAGTLSSNSEIIKEIDSYSTSTNSSSLTGIYIGSAGTSNNLIDFEIFNLNHKGTTTSTVLNGIYIVNTNAGILKRGIIYGLTNASTLGSIAGINNNAITTSTFSWDFWNNVVLLSNNTSGSNFQTISELTGIKVGASGLGKANYYHNTVEIRGAITNSSSGISSAFSNYTTSTSGDQTYKNNVFKNSRSLNASEAKYAIYHRYVFPTLTTMNYNSNYLETTGSPIASYNLINQSTISDWNTLSNGGSSVGTDITGSTTFSTALGVPSSGWIGANAGEDLTLTVIDDRLLYTRNPAPPAIGAYESITSLPIELISFASTCNGNSIDLEWETATEMNADYFNIEKSINGKDWETISTVKAVGNSIKKQIYSTTDSDVRSSTNYYRLVQYDLNGKFKKFDIVSSKCITEETFLIYPNPSQNNFNLLVNHFDFIGTNQITIKDLLGQIVLEKEAIISEGTNNLLFQKIDKPGVYILNINNEKKQSKSIKFIVQ